MIADGERLKGLMQSARSQVLLCAPFIKVGVIEALFHVIGEGVSVRIVTRWRAEEVAVGVSDLEVFELTNERPNTELALLDDLHAKLYLVDSVGLAGSANLTAAALGWSQTSNVELLLPVNGSDPDVARLIRRLDCAMPATFTMRSKIEEMAAALKITRLFEGAEISEPFESMRKHAWLPGCAAPDKLWAIYNDPVTSAVVQDTRQDGLSDLRDLHIPAGLPHDEFVAAIRDTLNLMPAFQRIIEHIPRGLTDADGVAIISDVRPDLERAVATLQWRIVRDWIFNFFVEYEVAPESFVVRLRPK